MGDPSSGVPPRGRRSRAEVLMSRAGLGLVAAIASWMTFEDPVRLGGVAAGLAVSLVLVVMAVRAHGQEAEGSPREPGDT